MPSKIPVIGDRVMFLLRSGVDRPGTVTVVHSDGTINIVVHISPSEDHCASCCFEKANCQQGSSVGMWHW